MGFSVSGRDAHPQLSRGGFRHLRHGDQRDGDSPSAVASMTVINIRLYLVLQKEAVKPDFRPLCIFDGRVFWSLGARDFRCSSMTVVGLPNGRSLPQVLIHSRQLRRVAVRGAKNYVRELGEIRL